ncbi:MAG: MaoC family dehydratase N-terminal domain-containing protein [Rhizobiaceae bacterium]
MSAIDLETLRQWIGRTEETSDVLTPGLLRRFEATFSDLLQPSRNVPPGVHWCLSPAVAAMDEIGEDGHPKKGGFLPPVPLPRRMWAGGEVEFRAPVEAGDVVTRRSRIADIAARSGRSGDLVFVTVEHEHFGPAGMAIRERQDIVYREAATAPAPPPVASGEVEDADERQTVECGSVMLFRYSALTFNGHRIHYDRSYATEVEHYPGLVVHGPLQATMLMNFASGLRPGRTLLKVAYRGVSPLIQGAAFTLNARAEGDAAALWTAGSNGALAMRMSASFS